MTTEAGPAAAVPPARPGRAWRALLHACEYGEAILVAVLLALYSRAFVVQAFEIPSGSMEETLLVGDHVIVNKFVHAPHRGPWRSLLPYRDVARGEVVVFRSPERPEIDLVKRVVALPGDTLALSGKRLLLGGRPVPEPYARFTDPQVLPASAAVPEPLRGRDQMPERRVPDGSFFAMGDNRDDSRDSRVFGTVPLGLVKGRAVLVYWSRRSAPSPSPDRAGPARRLLHAALHFAERTRWRRTFTFVR